MLLLVGLGNPGTQYQDNRHNIGFMAVDAIAARHRFGPWRSKYAGVLAEGLLDGHRALALKPQTFMNESGRSVGQAARFFKIPPQDVIVFHDDLDLAAGKVRMKTGGGHAGHNGLRSIDALYGGAYRRVRLGIGHPGFKEAVLGWVLGDFSPAERVWLDPLMDAVAMAAPVLAEGDDAAFTTRLALIQRPAQAKT